METPKMIGISSARSGGGALLGFLDEHCEISHDTTVEGASVLKRMNADAHGQFAFMPNHNFSSVCRAAFSCGKDALKVDQIHMLFEHVLVSV